MANSNLTDIPDYLLSENQLDSDENRGLFKAALAGSLYGVENYLKKGAKPNYFYRPEDQKNALHIASEKGFIDIVELLLKNNAEVNSISSSDQTTALILACQNDKPELIQLLLKYGADVNHCNGYGNSALHEACRNGYFNIVKCLLDENANINQINHKGSTPLHIFCYSEDKNNTRSMDLLKLLLKYGANINLPDNRGITPVLVCSISGRFYNSIIYKNEGANIDDVDNQGKNMMDIAKFYKQPEIIKYLENRSKK